MSERCSLGHHIFRPKGRFKVQNLFTNLIEKREEIMQRKKRL